MAPEPCIKHHLGGEEGFVFPTAGGPVELKVTDDALTPYGGLVPCAAFARKCGIIEQLARTCPHQRRSPNAAKVYDVLQSFTLTARWMDGALATWDGFGKIPRSASSLAWIRS